MLFIHFTLSLKVIKHCTDGCKLSQTITSDCMIVNLKSLQFNNQDALDLILNCSVINNIERKKRKKRKNGFGYAGKYVMFRCD